MRIIKNVLQARCQAAGVRSRNNRDRLPDRLIWKGVGVINPRDLPVEILGAREVSQPDRLILHRIPPRTGCHSVKSAYSPERKSESEFK